MQRIDISLPAGTTSALRFGDPSLAPQLVFCHANGFNAQTYRAVIEPLGVPALAFDLRGHGMSRLPADPQSLAKWNIFADDIVALFDRTVTAPVLLAGHSYGAVSAILALPRIHERVSGYVGFDPVFVPRLAKAVSATRMGREMMKRRFPIARKAGQRRAVFDNIEAAFARYQGRGAFRRVPDQVLRDYLEGGLVPTSDGEVRLACDPAWEQAIYTAQSHDTRSGLRRLPDGAQIVFAGGPGQVSAALQRRALARRLPHVSVSYEPTRSHIFPLEEPDFATEILRGAIQRTFTGG